MCGGSCVPGTKKCNSNTLQTCSNDGAWVTDTVCSGTKPKCDMNLLACAQRSNGDACNSSSECANGSCAFGVCCNETCDASCNTSCAGGTCVHKANKTQCGKRTGVYAGNSDIYLYCDTGKCVGPTFRCGSSSSCDLTANTCCMTSPQKDETNSGATIIMSCLGSASFCVCGDGSCDTTTNTNHRWKSCVSTLDCPAGLYCGANQGTFGALGYLFFECVPPSAFGNTWTVEVCDPTRSMSGQCTRPGTTYTCRTFGEPDDPSAGGCS